jgi:hypothetical protein
MLLLLCLLRQGINKAVILGMVDTMLANKEVSCASCKRF